MAEVEPQFASDYDDRTTVSVRPELVEIGQVLGSYQGKFAVIGGAVPWLLLQWPNPGLGAAGVARRRVQGVAGARGDPGQWAALGERVEFRV